MARPPKIQPRLDYEGLKPQTWRPNKPCLGCGAPPEIFERRTDLYCINPPRANLTWTCAECSTLLGTLLNLIFGPLGAAPPPGPEPAVNP